MVFSSVRCWSSAHRVGSTAQTRNLVIETEVFDIGPHGQHQLEYCDGVVWILTEGSYCRVRATLEDNTAEYIWKTLCFDIQVSQLSIGKSVSIIIQGRKSPKMHVDFLHWLKAYKDAAYKQLQSHLITVSCIDHSNETHVEIALIWKVGW